ncbi:MAG: hypothetical protein ACJ8AW_33560 [Rhodopila sp.]
MTGNAAYDRGRPSHQQDTSQAGTLSATRPTPWLMVLSVVIICFMAALFSFSTCNLLSRQQESASASVNELEQASLIPSFRHSHG